MKQIKYKLLRKTSHVARHSREVFLIWVIDQTTEMYTGWRSSGIPEWANYCTHGWFDKSEKTGIREKLWWYWANTVEKYKYSIQIKHHFFSAARKHAHTKYQFISHWQPLCISIWSHTNTSNTKSSNQNIKGDNRSTGNNNSAHLYTNIR